MAYTQEDLDSINKAIASGVLKYKKGDREVGYNTSKDLLNARDEIKKELDKVLASTRRPAAYLVTSRKGL